ncbi:MAG: T9SS type A sorting domain-containing protein [Bacteroidota bacterium]
MKLHLPIFIFCLLPFLMNGQVYLEQFDDGVDQNTSAGTGLTTSEADGEWTITGDGSSGAFEIASYSPFDENGDRINIDITENNKVFVRAKASNLGTQLRMDIVDADGFHSSMPGIAKTLLNDYIVFEYDFSNVEDGGFGGTACNSGPCPVDGSKVSTFNFYVNPGQGSFSGTVKIDFISVGAEPSVGPMSDVWQIHFDGDSSLNFIGTPMGYTSATEDSQWKITGDGTSGEWDPMNIVIHNETTLEEIDIDVSGNDKIYLRMKATEDGTSIRVDLQDINNMATTGGSITKVISTEWETYEFNFAGSYTDLAFGGTGCDVGPCPVDASRIANLIIFVNPGVGAYAGEVAIEYISVGTALEANPGGNLDLVYGDHFTEDETYVNTTGAYSLEVESSTLKITGDGTDAPFSAIAYNVHDENGGIVLDVTGNDKMFFRAKSSVDNTLLRIDLVDTTDFITTLPSFTKLLTVGEYSTYELDFRGNYSDGGYGGTPCDMGPCPVDGKAINTVLLYPNPADGAFNGTIEIDYLSFGAPMEEDVQQYSNHFDDANRSNISDSDGFTITEEGTELTIVGDGMGGQFAAFSYSFQDDNGDPLLIDLTSNNKLFIKAKSTVDGVPFRIDLVDADGFASTEPSTVRTVGTEYTIIEYDFSGTYSDGGYGGTACDMGPCPVDGQRIASLLLYIDPENGGYDGTFTMDWLSTIRPLEDPGPSEPAGLAEYFDQFDDDKNDFVTDMTGLVSSEADGNLTITGDGTSAAFSPIAYTLHLADTAVIVNADGDNDLKLFIRVKSTKADMPLRIDLKDDKGFITSSPGVEVTVPSDFTVLEYDYSGKLNDGGFGGTPCTSGPCPVNGERISSLDFYLDPGIGEFNGELVIDWVSFGKPLVTSVLDVDKLESIQLFPNPAVETVYLQMNALAKGELSVNIYNLSGQQIKSINMGSTLAGQVNEELPVNDLNTGLYLIEVRLDDEPIAISKLVKQ